MEGSLSRDPSMVGERGGRADAVADHRHEILAQVLLLRKENGQCLGSRCVRNHVEDAIRLDESFHQLGMRIKARYHAKGFRV